MMDIYEKIVAERNSHREFAICLITQTAGSVPRSAGAKMLVYPDGKIWGTIGGGKVELKVIEDALIAMQQQKCSLKHYDLVKQLKMSCGGSMDVYIEPVMSRNKLYIFGAGHTGRALAKRAMEFDFEVTIIDDRSEYLEDIILPEAKKIHNDYVKALQTLFFDSRTYITIMTYSHDHDRDILSYCLKQPHNYIGMIGSMRKVEETKKQFIATGLASLEELAKIDMPMGIEIDADGPDEISISILAKLLAVKNKKDSI